MTAANTTQIARRLAGAVGAIDLLSGAGLCLWPTLMLPVMLLPVPGAEALVYLRFVGMFVAVIGVTCLWAWKSGRATDLRAVLRFTIPFRMGAAVFCGVAVTTGALGAMWLGVAGVDIILVAVQRALLRRKWEDVA